MQNISRDFGVQLLNEAYNYKLYAEVRNLHYHVVLNKMISTGQYMMFQTHIHRYELAQVILNYRAGRSKDESPLKEYMLSNQTLISFPLSGGELDMMLSMHGDSSAYPFISQGSICQAILNEDIELLNKIKFNNAKKPGFKLKLIESLLKVKGVNQDMIFDKINGNDLELIAFEMALLRKKKRLFKDSGIYMIYGILLGKPLTPSDYFKDLLFDLLPFALSNESCDCGSPGCFFDMFKASERKYFNVSGILEANGELNQKIASHHFDKVWHKFTNKQKALLLFLHDQFENTSLLNMAFFNDDFDLDHYIYCMCFPYQPDSDEEQNIRVISSVANYFISYSRSIST